MDQSSFDEIALMWPRERFTEYVHNKIAGRKNPNPAIAAELEKMLVTRDNVGGSPF
jgi:hypothetical protein